MSLEDPINCFTAAPDHRPSLEQNPSLEPRHGADSQTAAWTTQRYCATVHHLEHSFSFNSDSGIAESHLHDRLPLVIDVLPESVVERKITPKRRPVHLRTTEMRSLSLHDPSSERSSPLITSKENSSQYSPPSRPSPTPLVAVSPLPLTFTKEASSRTTRTQNGRRSVSHGTKSSTDSTPLPNLNVLLQGYHENQSLRNEENNLSVSSLPLGASSTRRPRPTAANGAPPSFQSNGPLSPLPLSVGVNCSQASLSSRSLSLRSPITSAIPVRTRQPLPTSRRRSTTTRPLFTENNDHGDDTLSNVSTLSTPQSGIPLPPSPKALTLLDPTHLNGNSTKGGNNNSNNNNNSNISFSDFIAEVRKSRTNSVAAPSLPNPAATVSPSVAAVGSGSCFTLSSASNRTDTSLNPSPQDPSRHSVLSSRLSLSVNNRGTRTDGGNRSAGTTASATKGRKERSTKRGSFTDLPEPIAQ